MRLVDDPDERLFFPSAKCRGCGEGLAGEPVSAQRRHQVTDIAPAPEPRVTEYVAQAKACPCCGAVTEGELPAGVRAGQLRAGGVRAGREPGHRALRPGLPGDATAVRARFVSCFIGSSATRSNDSVRIFPLLAVPRTARRLHSSDRQNVVYAAAGNVSMPTCWNRVCMPTRRFS
jgi:hypothetical protein